MEILYEIVSAAKMSARKTHLVYKSNVSFKQLDVYLSSLINAGLIEESYEQDIGRVYNATSKGLNFLEIYESMTSILNSEPLKHPKVVDEEEIAEIRSLGISSQDNGTKIPLIEKAALA
ncbi:MAG: winged helix-turn-helix domain-containing protein [Nitrososphaerales archaeon]